MFNERENSVQLNCFVSKPLDWLVVTQPYGANYVDWYKQFGLDGH